MDTDLERGLSAGAAASRLETYGPNTIRSRESVPLWRIALRQVTDPLIYVLLIAAAVSLLFGEYIDAIFILIVVVINGVVGFVQEARARQAIDALAQMTAPTARVLRDGKEQEIAGEEIVPGDVVVMAAGDLVPADARVVEVEGLEADEAALTGESQPASKQEEPVEDRQAVPGDRFSMVFSGTDITRGWGRGVVVGTGDDSELGHIAEQTQGMAEVETPIQRKMAWLGKAIGVAILALSLFVVVVGLLSGTPLDEIVRTAVALAVGTVPEALPIVLTVTLAIGVQRMAKRHAIIRSLPAVETLGSTTVIASDKTGTLTTNQMTVKVVWAGGRRVEVDGAGREREDAAETSRDGELEAAGDGTIEASADGTLEAAANGEAGEAVRLALLAGLLANEAQGDGGAEGDAGGNDGDAGGDDGAIGDPTEVALLVAARKAGFDVEATRERYTEIDMIPFESERQFMATLNETPEGRRVFAKGSPEAILDRCTRRLGPDGSEEELDAAEMRRVAEELADEGYRVLAMASAPRDIEAFEGEDVGPDLVFIGFQGMEDPVRPEAVHAVKLALRAGVRVIMLTGDHARTARAIGQQLGLADGPHGAVEGRTIDESSEEELDRIAREVNVFARVSPDHKLKLVERLKSLGHIVAVTGDGVNDAPALQAAHLGIAMGKSGTDVAREASDMVLTDDDFASITDAIEEGRVVFSNIRNVTYFLFSIGIALGLVVLSPLAGPWPLPFVAVQVLWINLVTSGLQDVALAFEPGAPDLLEQPPRDPREGVVDRHVLRRMVLVGVFMAAVTLGVFWWLVRQDDVSMEFARSIAMTQLVLMQFFHAFNCRSFRRSVFRIPPQRNPYLLGAVLLAFLAQLAVLHVGFMQGIFGTTPISLEWWGVLALLGFSVVLVSELDKALLRRGGKRPGE